MYYIGENDGCQKMYTMIMSFYQNQPLERSISSKGPFSSEEGGQRIMLFLKESVFPTLREVQELSLEVASYTQGFLNSFDRRQFWHLENRYQTLNKRFLTNFHIYQTPDELFKEETEADKKDAYKSAMLISDYMKTVGAIKPHFDEGFRLLEIIDRTLLRYAQSADQRVATILSLTAITVTIINAFWERTFLADDLSPEIQPVIMEFPQDHSEEGKMNVDVKG